ncbi:tail protein [Pseudomonas phage Psa21]|uniref:Virion structural protein n=1 Tax=Pseudomonas phage Psa21 TaxID=2530023 RepID=A0A481W4K7_9CAUD|nr:tail protein [Pseudomonas phage Psa21]QBJ02710.1 virion structural protein [Pseudomonas phage Psa21]
MATLSTTGLYPEDLNGNNPLNLVQNEIQTLTVPGKDDYYFIIPKAAPFFVDSLEVVNAQTGQVYKEDEDYLVGHWFIEAMDSIGRPIAGSIRFMKRTIVGQVRLKYRTIGGNWGFSDTQILAELNRKLLNPLVRSWGMIGELPYSFPALEHDQSIDSLIGSKEIEEAISRLADIVEAAAAGASDQHLKDFGNPHRVTKDQTGLGLVQNFGMATNPEAIQGSLTNRYISPASMMAAINAIAVAPLNAHITATGNVHSLRASDINLGNVPNYAAANPTQAIDVTNNSTLTTPYSVALMIQKLAGTSRIDDIEAKLNAHLADINTNPHKVTADQVNTYTKQIIDQKIAQASGGGGNADTFDGKTPAEWAAQFVSTDEFNTFISSTQFGGAVTEAFQAVNDPTLIPDPSTIEEDEAKAALLVNGGMAMYDAYGLWNGSGDNRLVADTSIPMYPSAGAVAFPEFITGGQDRWVSQLNARYYVTARGGIISSGSAAIGAPVGWKDDASFAPANAVSAIWATKTELFAMSAADGSIRRFKADNTNVVVVAATATRKPVSMRVSPQLVNTQSLGVAEVEVGDEEDFVVEYVPLGDATFVTSMNNLMNTVKATDPIADIRIGETQILILTETKGVFLANINRANPAAITVALVASPTATSGDGVVVGLRSAGLIDNSETGTGIAQISGMYDHFAMLTNKGKPYFIGDNSQGQCEVKVNQVPLLTIMAGYKFTVTVNNLNQAQFFGDSPDNSLLFSQRGISIDPNDPDSAWYK